MELLKSVINENDDTVDSGKQSETLPVAAVGRRRGSVSFMKDNNADASRFARRKSRAWGGSSSDVTDFGFSTTFLGNLMKAANTYRLEPTENQRFHPKKVEDVINSTLKTYIPDTAYNTVESARLAKLVSNRILQEIKTLGYTRHKLVCNVVIMERIDQGNALTVASRFLWDPDSDDYASATYETPFWYSLAVVYGLYFP